MTWDISLTCEKVLYSLSLGVLGHVQEVRETADGKKGPEWRYQGRYAALTHQPVAVQYRAGLAARGLRMRSQ
jgi:hypothetical protein